MSKSAIALVTLTLVGLALVLARRVESQRATPSSPGISLQRCKNTAAYNARCGGVSFVVLQRGKVIFEDYPNGHSIKEPHLLASGTKSFAGTAALAAQEDGLLKLDEPVSSTITEWQGNSKLENITVRQLLSLVSGIESTVARPPTYADSLKPIVTASPGERFQYGPGPFQVFGELMRRKLKKTNETMVDYLKRRVLDPADVRVAIWRNGSDGMPQIPSGAAITAREWAKFGQFILDGGNVAGKQILQAKDFQALFIGTQANPMYGLTWWLNRPMDDKLHDSIRLLTMSTDLHYGTHGVPDDLVMAAGAGNQRLYIVPSRQLVVVRQADKNSDSPSDHKAKFSDTTFWQLLTEDNPSQK